MENLPEEVLMKFLGYSDSKDLLNFRLVDKTWNRIARDILKSRDDLEVVFKCIKNIQTGNMEILGKPENATLENFSECFEFDETPLYTHFRFRFFEKAVFYDPHWIQFLSQFGRTIKCLKLEAHFSSNNDELLEFVGKLRHLLLVGVPNLREFGVQYFHLVDRFSFLRILEILPASLNIQLFPGVEAQLPHLKVLHVDHSSFGENAGILTGLLRASPNLQKIVRPNMSDVPVDNLQNFQFLQAQGKLHCFQDASINLDEQLLSRLNHPFPLALEFKLKTLKLENWARFEDPSDKRNVAQFLSNLFQASKNTLRELDMQYLGFLPDLELPKFSKLAKLRVVKFYGIKATAFPSGINLTETFPVLQRLDLRGNDFSPLDESVSSLPNLKTLMIRGDEVTKKVIARISLVCPNLKEFVITGAFAPLQNFPEVGTAIWTHLKQLESLDLQIYMDAPANAFPNVDACFTGFSGEDCIRLYDFMENEKLAGNEGAQEKLDLDLNLVPKRENPSILDLKGLKYLSLFPASSALSKTTLSLSEKYAFKLMDHLYYEIRK